MLVAAAVIDPPSTVSSDQFYRSSARGSAIGTLTAGSLAFGTGFTVTEIRVEADGPIIYDSTDVSLSSYYGSSGDGHNDTLYLMVPGDTDSHVMSTGTSMGPTHAEVTFGMSQRSAIAKLRATPQRFIIAATTPKVFTFGSNTVSDQTYVQNAAISTLQLPAASGGNSPLTYSITPALPTGLTFTESTRQITGTPTVTLAQTEYTYTVADADGDTATITFNITVAADLMPSFGASTVSDQAYSQNEAITALTLPAATGGNGSLAYALSPALPAGLTFTQSTRQIAGTPTAGAAPTQYTYTVADYDGDTAAITFNITVIPWFPEAPADLTATPSDTQITLTWDDPSTPGITGYQLNQKINDTWGAWADIPNTSASTTSHTILNLTNDVAYTFAIRALNTHGNSPPAGPVTATPIPSSAKPTGLTATAGNAQVALNWNNPNNATITRYQYNQQVDGTWGAWTDIPGSSAATTSHAVSNLTNGVAYTFTIRAVDAAGNTSPPADTVTATPLLPPAKPTGLTAAVGNGQLTLSWDNPNDSTISRYQYNQKVNDVWGAWADIPSSGAGTTSYVVQNLTNGVAYISSIRAVNQGGNSPPGDPVTATPLAPPAKPTGLAALAGNTQVRLSWNHPSDATITKYQYNQQVDGTWGAWTDVPGSGTSTNSYTVRSLINGATYTFAIRAFNPGGNSPPSDTADATPVAGPTYTLGQPTSFTATAGDGQVTLRWDDPFDGTIIGYQYQQWEGPGAFGELTTIPGSTSSTTSHTIQDLTNGISYTFGLRAVNAGGSSNPVTATATPTEAQSVPLGMADSPTLALPPSPVLLHPFKPTGLISLTAGVRLL